jgi:hypothetical protein
MTTASYAALLELSRQMLEQAKRQEWESLPLTQEQRVSLIAGIVAKRPALTTSEIAALAPTIRKIQELDREILEYVTPWRDDVAKLLSRLAPSQ